MDAKEVQKEIRQAVAVLHGVKLKDTAVQWSPGEVGGFMVRCYAKGQDAYFAPGRTKDAALRSLARKVLGLLVVRGAKILFSGAILRREIGPCIKYQDGQSLDRAMTEFRAALRSKGAKKGK